LKCGVVSPYPSGGVNFFYFSKILKTHIFFKKIFFEGSFFNIDVPEGLPHEVLKFKISTVNIGKSGVTFEKFLEIFKKIL
jgi:hypothetical protein